MTAWSANAPAVVRRLARAFPAIGPRARARLLAGFLAANFVIVLLSMSYRLGWGEQVLGTWLTHLNFEFEGGYADRYSGILFGVVAMLAAAQLFRPPVARSGPRWLWTLGWLGMALLVGLTAFEELHRSVDAGALVGSVLPAEGLVARFRWILVVVLLATPLAAWVLFVAQRGHPARMLLTLLAVALALNAMILDVTGDLRIYSLLARWLGFGDGIANVRSVLEESSELMAAAALAVVLTETLAARPRPARDVLDLSTGGGGGGGMTAVGLGSRSARCCWRPARSRC